MKNPHGSNLIPCKYLDFIEYYVSPKDPKATDNISSLSLHYDTMWLPVAPTHFFLLIYFLEVS